MIFFFVFCSIYTTFLLLRSRKLLGLGKKKENLFVLLSTFRNFANRNKKTMNMKHRIFAALLLTAVAVVGVRAR